MLTDEIVEEVRANREAHAAKFNYDLRAIYDDLKRLEKKHIQQGYLTVESETGVYNKKNNQNKLRKFTL